MKALIDGTYPQTSPNFLVGLLVRWIDSVRPSGGRCCADHPAFIFQVVGQSRDDVLTVVQVGGHHPGSQFNKDYLATSSVI